MNRLERLDAPEQSQTLKFRFPKAEFSADKVLTVEELFLSYGERDIVEDVSFMIRRGEAVALIGPNGAGKSTLLKAITGELTPEAGFIDIGSRVSVGYFSQEHEELHPAWTPVDEIMSHFNYSEEKARNVLGMFMFQGDDVFKEIRDLSGGERARLSLLILFLQGNNFLILDEPTNHLDIPTREVVEDALMNFTGTLLVVSHDRYFLDKVSKRTLVLEPEGVEEYLGNYSYYKAKLKEQQDLAALQAAQSNQNDSRAGGKNRNTGNNSTNSEAGDFGNTDNSNNNDNRDAERNNASEGIKINSFMQAKKLEETETEIARLEATLKMYEVQIQNPALQEDAEALAETAAHMEATNKKLAELYELWEQLAQ